MSKYEVGGDTVVVVGSPAHRYDLDGDGNFSLAEVIGAIRDYFSNLITFAQVIEIISFYFTGGTPGTSAGAGTFGFMLAGCGCT